MADFYHVCFAVPDLQKATDDLREAVGVRWCEPRAGQLGSWEYQIVFSEGAPYIEVIEGPVGSPWDASAGPRFDHLGWWTNSVEVSSRRLDEAGFPVDFSGCPFGRSFAYHRVDSIGARVEVVDVRNQAGFFATWDPSGVPTRALDCLSSSPPKDSA